jgi:hypothetical protein
MVLLKPTPRVGRLIAVRQRGALLILLLTLVAAGCGRETSIYEGRISSDGRVVLLIVGACNADLEVEVDERADAVGVRVRVSNAWEGDCAGSVHFGLSEPLGDRVLIDASTGNTIPVRVDESVTVIP